MSPRTVPAQRLVALVAALAITAAGVAMPATAAAAPAYTLEERATAIASPSLVFVEETFTGYLRDRKTHAPLIASPITLGRRCSGFVVNADGYIATPISCVKPSDAAVRTGVLYEAAEALIQEHKLERGARDTYVNHNLPNTEFTGPEPGSAPQVQLYAQFNVATAGTTDAPAVGGQVVATLETSDIAIVKLAQGNLPVAELQPQGGLDQGAALVAIGYSTSDPDSRKGSFTLTTKSVQVTGQGTLGALTFAKINGDVGRFSTGGMAVDSSGRVVGMLNNDWTQAATPVRAITSSAAIVEALAQVPATNTLSNSDKQFRSGLDAYFRGDYKTAINQLSAVTKDVPTNRVAVAYRQQAEDRQKIEAQSSGVPVWVWIAGAAVLGGLIAGLVVALVLSSRRRRQSEAELLVPVSLNPFAPTSSMPFSAPPTSGLPSMYQGTAIPHPAPPGVPVPLPPSVFPPGGRMDEPQPVGPQAIQPQSAPPVGPSAPPPPAPATMPPAPMEPTEQAQAEAPEFIWPDEEDDESRPGADHSANPWSPPAR